MKNTLEAILKMRLPAASAALAFASMLLPAVMTQAQTLTILANFDNTDGANPLAGLVQGTNGNLYGTTLFGGANLGGDGTVFEITPSGTLTTPYSFCSLSGCADGDQPTAGLVQATNGDFYGTTSEGGAYGSGTVFKITLGGTLTTLHSFCAQSTQYCTDGLGPDGLVQATNGNLYGTTTGGGANGDGTVFKITPSGTLTTLHTFDRTDGSGPYAGLVQATNGNLYGTTYSGGASGSCANFAPSGCGTVFSLSVGLGPFVKTLPTSGKVGAAIKILGTDLTGATAVSFNGTAAAFTVVSSSEITTTVPAGATSGEVEVATPSGTLTSNVNFRVTP